METNNFHIDKIYVVGTVSTSILLSLNLSIYRCKRSSAGVQVAVVGFQAAACSSVIGTINFCAVGVVGAL